MALRTFHSNPALGGFGSESSNYHHLLLQKKERKGKPVVDGDAFAQIIKELVDNAVDACYITDKQQTESSSDIPKRVRVEIQRFRSTPDISENKNQEDSQHGSTDNEDDDDDEILRVTVTDNGCGMKDIKACVDPFHTSKAHGDIERQTAGRYGIGLTLCLLHAQRLVPGSCAIIRSAVAEQSHWTTYQCIIDAEKDTVHCSIAGTSHQHSKSIANESGTAVSLLVPVSTVNVSLSTHVYAISGVGLTTIVENYYRAAPQLILPGLGWQSILLDSN